ncbi:MAG: SRPBCC family protein [Actinomycetota bacterium]|nr:SRPBCC family protein [Actinomycetota bacterium]
MAETSVTTQVYRVYIKATPEAVWDAITKPEWTDRYGYGGTVDGDLRTGAPYRILAGTGMQAAGVSGPIIDGELIEVDPPRKLVQTWRMLMDEELSAEGFTRLTWEIEEGEGGVTRLTVVHDLEGAPKLAHMVAGGLEDVGAGGGWSWILSDLKTLLETGESFIHKA